jgi:hypothetical protein
LLCLAFFFFFVYAFFDYHIFNMIFYGGVTLNHAQNKILTQTARLATLDASGIPALKFAPTNTRLCFGSAFYISLIAAVTKNSGTRSCCPSRKYFRKLHGMSFSSISASTNRLCHLGLLSKFQRRPINGNFQTNLYRLEGPVLGILAHWLRKILLLINRVASRHHIVTKTNPYIEGIDSQGETVGQFTSNSPPDFTVSLGRKLGFA